MNHWQIVTIGIVADVDKELGDKIMYDLMHDFKDKVVWINGKEVYGSEFWIRSDHIIGMHYSTPETRQAYREYQKSMEEEGKQGWE